MEDRKVIFEHWGETHPDFARRRKRRRIIVISAILATVFFITFMSILTSTDLIVRPIPGLSSTSGPGEWSMFGRDRSHSNSLDAENSLPSGIVSELFKADAELHSAPVFSQGTLFFGARDFRLYAIHARDGSVRWTFQAGSYIDSVPTVAGKVVYFGSNDGKLYALDVASGDKIWEFKSQFPVRSSAAVAEDRVYFGADDYFIYAVDSSSGREVWKFETENDILSSPVVANGIVYIASQDDNLYALNARNGRLRLQFPAGGAGSFSPVEAGGNVYIASASGLLTAIEGNARNWFGEERIRPNWQALTIYGLLPNPPTVSGYLWSTKLGGRVVTSPTLSGNIVVLGMTNKAVAVDILTHTRLWEFATPGRVSGNPAAANGRIYLPCENGHLYILDAATGTMLKDILVGGNLNSAPLVVGSTIYLGSQDGRIFSVR